MTIPPSNRVSIARARAAEPAVHEAVLTKPNAWVRGFEHTNEDLGKAIGLFHSMNEQEPDAIPVRTDPSDS